MQSSTVGDQSPLRFATAAAAAASAECFSWSNSLQVIVKTLL